MTRSQDLLNPSIMIPVQKLCSVIHNSPSRENCQWFNQMWITQLLPFISGRTNRDCLYKGSNVTCCFSATFPFPNPSLPLPGCGFKDPLSQKEQPFFPLEDPEGRSQEEVIMSDTAVTWTSLFCRLDRDTCNVELRFLIFILKCPMVYSWVGISNFLEFLQFSLFQNLKLFSVFPRIKFKINFFFLSVHKCLS